MVLTPTDIVTTDNCATTGTVSGECTVVVNSDASRYLDCQRRGDPRRGSGPEPDVDHPRDGDQDNIDLFPGSQRGDDADKTYVNLRIEITPLTDTNAVNDAHTFTVTVEKTDVMNPGEHDWVPVVGVSLDFPESDVTPDPDTTEDLSDCMAANVTDANGQCVIVINSSVAGTFTAHVQVTLVVDPGPNQTSITRETGDQDNIDLFPGSERGDDAEKTYISFTIIVLVCDHEGTCIRPMSSLVRRGILWRPLVVLRVLVPPSRNFAISEVPVSRTWIRVIRCVGHHPGAGAGVPGGL